MNVEANPRGVSPEYQPLPEDISAVVMNGSSDLKIYYVVLGKVSDYPDTESLEKALNENEDIEWLPVPLFDPTHWITLQPLEQRRGVIIDVSPSAEGNAKLKLVHSVIDRLHPIREASIDLTTLRESGIDVEMQKGEHDYDGTILGQEAAQLLHDFQQGQGQFAETEL